MRGCTKKGEKTYTCGTCGDTYTEEIAAGHTLTQVEAKAATCTEDGWAAYEYCTECDYTTFAEIGATGHDYDAVVTAPTCADKGYTTYTCTVCGYTYKGDEVEATGHAYGDGVVTKEATETEEGEMTYTCGTCGGTKTEVIPVKDHEHSYVEEVIAPTCTEEGYTEVTCENGDCDYYEKKDIVPAKGHTEGAAVEENRVEATETEDGSYDSVVRCTVCNAEISRETIVIPAMGGGAVSYTVNFINYTAAGKNQAAIKIGDTEIAYQQKTAVQATLGEDGTFVVSCLQACAVAYSVDGENYTEIAGIANGDGTYRYVIENPVEEMVIAVVLCGDGNLDGDLDGKDITLIRRDILTDGTYLTGMKRIAADIKLDDVLDGKDITLIRRYILNNT